MWLFLQMLCNVVGYEPAEANEAVLIECRRDLGHVPPLRAVEGS